VRQGSPGISSCAPDSRVGSSVRLPPMPAPGVDSAAQLRKRVRRSQSSLSSSFFEVFEVFVVRFLYATASLQGERTAV